MASQSNTAAEEALKAARSSQRLSSRSTPLDPRKFTLNREAAKAMQNAAMAQSLANWLTLETGKPIRGEDLNDFRSDLEDGVVFCALAAKFGQITRFKDPPTNEFQRLENFSQFAQSLKRLGLSCSPPPSRRDCEVHLYFPCLLALAVLARKHSEGLEMESQVPEEVIDQATATAREEEEEERAAPPPPNTTNKNVVVISDLAKEIEEAEEEESMNSLLAQLHLERTRQRERHGPPRLRLIDIGNRQLVSIEKPGASMRSEVWPGSGEMIHCLQDLKKLVNTSSILELGSGCGLCGIWAACEGKDVVVTDLSSMVDLLWANVAANAQQVVRGGGSCSARALDFADLGALSKLVFCLEDKLTVFLADAVFGDQIRSVVNALELLFQMRPEVNVFVGYQMRDKVQEDAMFFSQTKHVLLNQHPTFQVFQILGLLGKS